MKLSSLTISAAAMAMVYGASALAQTAAPVTMQPIPNPPETAKAGHTGKHHSKHHAKATKAPKAEEKTDSTAPPPTK